MYRDTNDITRNQCDGCTREHDCQVPQAKCCDTCKHHARDVRDCMKAGCGKIDHPKWKERKR